MQEPAPPRPLAVRVVDTFVAPRRLVSDFGDGAPWFGVLLLATAGAMVLAATAPADTFLAQMEAPVNRRGEPVEITSSPAEIVRYGRMLAALSALAGHPLVTFALAGVVTLLFGVIGGGRSGYRRYLALSAHALLIPVLGLLVLGALGTALGHTLEPSLAPLLPFATTGSLAGEILAGVSFLQLWMLVVIGVGVSVLDGRGSWVRTTLPLVGLYLVLGVVTALLTRG